MGYIHYGANQFDRAILEKNARRNLGRIDWKPCGLWASPTNAQLSWKSWCEGEDWEGSDFSKHFCFELTPEAKVLHVRRMIDVVPYMAKSPYESYLPTPSAFSYLDYGRLCRDYDAIELHISDNYGELHERMFYTWDVDSICVWNPDVIAVTERRTMSEKLEKCREFFNSLAMLLYDAYDVMGSCNVDQTLYLVPSGTQNQVTYSSKPARSFRISDHWNWYANIKKCAKERYIQCWSVDVPYPRRREEPGKASEPRRAIQVAMIGPDGKYHCVYGEFFDRKTKTWGWLEANPVDVAWAVR